MLVVWKGPWDPQPLGASTYVVVTCRRDYGATRTGLELILRDAT
jgi:hypothetical protein